MMSSVLRGICWVILYVLVVATGWDEPLRYRFMSKEKIAEEEQKLAPPPPPPAEHSNMNGWRPAGTALDRASYRTRNSEVYYTDTMDRKGLGSATETQARPNLYIKGAGGPT